MLPFLFYINTVERLLLPMAASISAGLSFLLFLDVGSGNDNGFFSLERYSSEMIGVLSGMMESCCNTGCMSNISICTFTTPSLTIPRSFAAPFETSNILRFTYGPLSFTLNTTDF